MKKKQKFLCSSPHDCPGGSTEAPLGSWAVPQGMWLFSLGQEAKKPLLDGWIFTREHRDAQGIFGVSQQVQEPREVKNKEEKIIIKKTKNKTLYSFYSFVLYSLLLEFQKLRL